MDDLSQSIINKIKKKKIKPYPRWKFILKNYSWWFAGILSVLVGSLASSVVFYMLINNDWDIYKHLGTSLFSFILISAPYFWLIFLIIFIFLADYYLKNTKHGYRFSLIKIASLSMLVSLVLGAIFYNVGVAEFIDNRFSETVPIYNNLGLNKEKIWLQPEKGLLGGVILEIKSNNNFTIKDLNNKTWQIKADNLLLRPLVDFFPGGQVRLIGKMRGSNTFIASEIRPWMKRRQHIKKGMDNFNY